MTIGYCDPNGDVQKEWFPSVGTTHYVLIDGGIRQPTAPTTDNIGAFDGNENDIDRFYLTSLPDVDEVTSVVVWVYGRNSSGEPCQVDLQMGTIEAWEGYQTIEMVGGYGWFSVTFNGSWTQINLDQMQVRFKADNIYGTYDYTRIRAFYCEVTYSEVVVGYGHDFMGVPAANIDEVNGVPTANIDTIKGV